MVVATVSAFGECHPDPAVAGEGSHKRWLITLSTESSAHFDGEFPRSARDDELLWRWQHEREGRETSAPL